MKKHFQSFTIIPVFILLLSSCMTYTKIEKPYSHGLSKDDLIRIELLTGQTIKKMKLKEVKGDSLVVGYVSSINNEGATEYNLEEPRSISVDKIKKMGKIKFSVGKTVVLVASVSGIMISIVVTLNQLSNSGL